MIYLLCKLPDLPEQHLKEWIYCFLLYIFFFKKGFYLLIFREGEKHWCMVACCTPPTRDLVHNPGMCLDWESHWSPFGSQAIAQSTEPHQPVLFFQLLIIETKISSSPFVKINTALLCRQVFIKLNNRWWYILAVQIHLLRSYFPEYFDIMSL